MLENYWKKRQGFIIEPEDRTIDGCIVYEIAPFDGVCPFEPICVQNNFPFEIVESYNSRYKEDMFCYIEVIRLNQNHRGKGIGKEMLEKCVQDAKSRGAKAIFTIVSPEEKLSFSMEKWFTREGFSTISRSEEGVPLMVLEMEE